MLLRWSTTSCRTGLGYCGRNGKNSYCIGIANGLLRHANQEESKEEADAKKAERDAKNARIREEEAQRQAELSRLAGSPLTSAVDLPEDADEDASSTTSTTSWCPSWASDAIEYDATDQQDLIKEEAQPEEAAEAHVQADFRDNFMDLTGDDDADIYNLMSTFIPRADRANFQDRSACESAAVIPDHALEQMRRTDSAEPLDASKEDEEHKWSSHSQLILFRGTAKKIAQDYIKDSGIKIRNVKARDFHIDQSAYRQGKRDSNKVNVRAQAIRKTATVETPNAPSYVFTD